MGELISLVFRYRGTFNFTQFFKESKSFFIDRKMDFMEKVYKNKGDEIEGAWGVDWRVDMYTKISYEIEYKAIECKTVTVEKDGKRVEMIDAKIRVVITAKADENYTETGIAGPKTIFTKPKKGDSWLHKIYNKVTYRDRDEGTYGDAIILAHQYIGLLKQICNMDTRY